MDQQTLRENIDKKFGGLSQFARVVNEDRYKLQKLFARKEMPADELKRITALCRGNKNKITGNVLDPAKVKQLKKAIDDFGGVYRFCKENTAFNESQVYQFYNGTMFNKRKGKLVQALFDHFGIEP